MERRSYYLLLSALASSALAACQEEDCEHQVEIQGPRRTLSASDACQQVSVVSGVGFAFNPHYAIGGEACTKLCDDGKSDRCRLADDYVSAFTEANGPAVDRVRPDAASEMFKCPTWSEDVKVSCSRFEARGRYHEGCPVEGRRPAGLIASKRARRDELAEYLARCAHLEAASVLAFERLAAELAALGAPEELSARCLEAAREEMRHAELVGALARARGAQPERVEIGLTAHRCCLDLALENVAEGVVREAYGALQAVVRSQRAAAADVRVAMAAVARDEAAHAELSAEIAAWLETQLSAEERAQVAGEKRAAIAQLRRELDDEPSRGLQRELGLPSRALALRLVDQLERALWSSAAA